MPETAGDTGADTAEEAMPETAAEPAPDTAEEATPESAEETVPETDAETGAKTADEAVPEIAEETATGASNNPSSEKSEPDAPKTADEKASDSGKGEAKEQEEAPEESSDDNSEKETPVSERVPEEELEPDEVSEESSAGKTEEAIEEAEKTARTFPAFKQKQIINGVTVTVSADAGVFPEDAVLFVTEVPASEVEAAIGEVREDGVNVASSYTFDIKVLDADGQELQPADSQSVKVSFRLAEAADENLEAKVWHISGDESQGTLSAEELETASEGQTVAAQTDGFSYYTVEFTYGDLQYVLPGKKSVPLSVILDTVGLVGTATAVTVSDESLFSASRENGEWAVTSHQPFSTTEKMSVTIEGIEYEITVTDYHGTLYYYDENGQRIKLSEWFHIESSDDNDSSFTWNDNGFNQYVVHADEHVTYDRRIDVKNDVILILCDGASLTIKGGIHVSEGNSLTIYRQEHGTGELIITDVDFHNAGIGGNFREACGNVKICGGYIEVTGGWRAAGIGGGSQANGGHIMITGGTVNAYSGDGGAGIGGGSGFSSDRNAHGGTITITGGTVNAVSTSTDANNGAGIGGGWWSDGGTITITGGIVKADGNSSGAGIGGGEYGGGGSVTITGGTATVKGGILGSIDDYSQAIGHGVGNSNEGSLTLGDELNGLYIRAGSVSGETVAWADAADRVEICRSGLNVTIRVAPCSSHESTSYIDNHDGTHTSTCKYCGSPDKTESHTYTDGVCICGAVESIYTVTVEGGTADFSTAKAGDTVTITAEEPEAGYAFNQWAQVDGVDFDNASAAETTFTMPAKDVTVSAVFCEIILPAIDNQTYTGEDIEPTFGLFDVKLKGVDGQFVKGTHYDLSYSNNINVGKKATVTLTMLAPRTGSKSVNFQIIPADISTAEVSAIPDQEYAGTRLKPYATVTWNGKTLAAGTDYELSYSKNVDVGTATCIVTGKGNFTGTKDGSFMITSRPLTITAEAKSKIYGEDDPALTYTADGLVGGDSITGELARAVGEDVGAHAITQGTLTAGDNYAIRFTGADLTIKPAKATITVDSASKVVGEPDPTVFTGKVEGLLADGELGEIKYVRIGSEEAVGTYKGVLTAQYTENKNYDVTVKNGDFTIKQLFTVKWLNGDGSILQEKTYVEGEKPPVFDNKKPAKAETAQYTYEFSGWDNGAVDGTTTTYKPLFDEIVRQYTVTFVDYDGKTVLKEAAPYDYGTPAGQISLPDEPTREADAEYTYTFTGWTPKITDVTKEAVYTAVYASEKQSYKITWLQDDGSLIDETTVEYGETPAHADPAKEADAQYTYTFVGWDPEITEVSGEATYKATYRKTPVPAKKATLTFDLAGGTLAGKTGRITIEANVGDTIKLPGAPTRAGYTFQYWKGSEYEAGAEYKVKEDHTFTAEWEKAEEKEEKEEEEKEEKEEEERKTYTVTFNPNGHGRAPAAQAVEEGKKVSKPKDPTADGYIFGSWFTDRECTKAFDFNTAITKDVTLYAKWTKKNSSGSDGSSKKNTTKSSTTKRSTAKHSTTTGSKSGSSSSGSGLKSPATGDDNKTGMWLILAAASLLGLILAAVKKKQNR